MNQKLDILAFGAHPDDVEISAGGMLISEVKQGKKVGIIDLTYGELGTRGTVEIRKKEADAAAEIIGCAVRENLGFKDGFFQNDEAHQRIVITAIRKYCPDIVIVNSPDDRHPDHGRASALVKESAFLSGLRKIITAKEDGSDAWRPKAVYAYMQFYPFTPDFVYDISHVMEEKMACILAHKSQFYDPNSTEPPTVIASEHFRDNLISRASEYGLQASFRYGEPFKTFRLPGIQSLQHLM
ncbi:MAG: bacillithiol biosynthesis deacetylase BshB1 [Flavobacteriales bacterium]